MKTQFRTILVMLCLIWVGVTFNEAKAQGVIVNTAILEGLDITPDNMFGFQIQSYESRNIPCKIEGKIIFRNSDHSISYDFNYTVAPGLNMLDASLINPRWNFSSAALRELFMYHKVLPQGTYQYCVSISPVTPRSDQGVEEKVDDCIYKQSEDLFSITLLEPENDAKIYDYNPMLAWVATYPFMNELTYRIRIAEIKEGQNTENAIVRNNPVYSEQNLMSTSIIYPLYAKPLQLWQPYAWTVDAYYKGILLGGAQPWKFTIIEDSLYESLPYESSYIDINIDKGTNVYYAVGEVKLKYSENDFLQNELKVSMIKGRNGSKKQEMTWPVKRGVNFETYDMTDYGLRHNEEFEIMIEYKNTRSSNKVQTIKYKYVNPDYVK